VRQHSQKSVLAAIGLLQLAIALAQGLGLPLLLLGAQLLFVLHALVLAQQLGLARGLGRVPLELDEYRDLGLENLFLDGFEEKIDGAEFVACEDVLVVLAERGDEDDGDVPGLQIELELIQHLDAIYVRQLDIKNNSMWLQTVSKFYSHTPLSGNHHLVLVGLGNALEDFCKLLVVLDNH